MEEVLTVYASAYNPLQPVVCLDEQPQVLHGRAQDPLPLEPGQCARVDDEYTRQGTANVFCLFEPLRGWREMRVTERTGPLGAALSKTAPHAPRLCPDLKIPV